MPTEQARQVRARVSWWTWSSKDEADTEGEVRNTRFLFCDRLARQSLMGVLKRAFWGEASSISSVTLAERSEDCWMMSWLWTLGKAVWIRAGDVVYCSSGSGGGLLQR